MRYIPVTGLKDSMTLGHPLLDDNFRTLMGRGLRLESQHINKINEMGYGGVYIEDELSADIKANDVVSFDTRVGVVRASQEILEQAERGGFENKLRVTKVRQDKIIMPLLEEIIAAPKRIMDYVDIKPYNGYVHYHSANVVVLSLLVGIELGLSGTRLYELGLASLLCDIGNIFVPKELLNKQGKLTPEEFETVKQHTQMGFDYLHNNFDISIEGCMGAQQHHEYYNGEGYPNRLKKDKISIFGRVIAVTDVFDALISRRPYRQPMYPAMAMEFVEMNSGTMFDPTVVKALKNVVASYPSGFCVELTSGARCIVTDNAPGLGDRPKVRMIGGLSKTPLNVDLAKNPMFSRISVSHIVEV